MRCRAFLLFLAAPGFWGIPRLLRIDLRLYSRTPFGGGKESFVRSGLEVVDLFNRCCGGCQTSRRVTNTGGAAYFLCDFCGKRNFLARLAGSAYEHPLYRILRVKDPVA